MGLGLPKWPACFITGRRVTEHQASDIIRKTDAFFLNLGFYGGNLTEWNEQVRKICRIPCKEGFENENGEVNYNDYYDAARAWGRNWGILRLQDNYINNAWISSAYIGGAHGWVDFKGNIYYNKNIGKYPEVEEVFQELKVIAEAFPYLDLGVTLYDKEYCDVQAGDEVVSFQVLRGEVVLIDPKVTNVHQAYGLSRPVHNSSTTMQEALNLYDRRCEIGVSCEQLKLWTQQAFGDKDVDFG